MFKEFKTFINKGNVLMIAVGLIMADYFGAITKSLVNDIIMPPVGKIIGGVDFTRLKLVIQNANEEAGIAEISIKYGLFINTILTFLIVAIVMFFLIKWYNKMTEEAETKSE